MHRFAGVLICLFVVLVAGCGTGDFQGLQSPAPAALAMHGVMHGGQQAIAGAVIQLWAVGTTGDGMGTSGLIGPAPQMIAGEALTDGNGSFNITGQYTCPQSNPLVYLTGTGGNPGLAPGTNNTAISMMAVLGPCMSLTAASFAWVNEVTTVAAANELAPFMGANGQIGSGSGDAAALAAAFAAAESLVNLQNGTAPAATAGGAYVPQAELYSLANVLAACVNSSSASSPACMALFSAATPSGGAAPTTVLGAMQDIALNPGNNVGSLFTISQANAPFQPTLSAAPSQWTVATSYATTACGYSGSGYNVAGVVNYPGVKTGRIYLALNSNCGSYGSGTQGTSVPGRGGYTIRGVPPGTYTLNVYMDTLGYGAINASDPAGSATVMVGSANVGGLGVTLADPGTVMLTSAPTIASVGGTNGGAILSINGTTSNGRGVETAVSYTLQWSASASFSAIAGTKTVPAQGNGNYSAFFVSGLTDGSVYYFRAYGTSGGTAVGPYSAVYGPVTIGAPNVGSAVSGAISFTGTATGPMVAALYNQNSSTAPDYAQYIANPSSPQAFTVVVPNSASAVYEVVALIDQNNDGILDAGDLSSGDIQGTPIAVTGTIANQNLTLPSGNAVVQTATQHSQSGSTQNYSFGLSVHSLLKLPVAVTVLSSNNADGANTIGPMDIAQCGQNSYFSNCNQGFQIGLGLGSARPTAGDTYPLRVVYSDGTSETLTATVSAVLDALPLNLAPMTGMSTSVAPTFSWTDPVCAACGTYTYQFSLYGQSGAIWEAPNYGTGLPPGTTFLNWGVDPTDPTNTASNLTLGQTYTWTVSVQDGFYNSATSSVSYRP